MARITGIGGVFFKTSDTEATRGWLADALGLETHPFGTAFPWLEREGGAKGYTVLGLHSASSDYFDPSTQPFMVNFRVDDLDGMLERLRAKGAVVTKVFDPEPNGRFAHVMGPDGIKFELWEPVADDPYDP